MSSIAFFDLPWESTAALLLAVSVLLSGGFFLLWHIIHSIKHEVEVRVQPIVRKIDHIDRELMRKIDHIDRELKRELPGYNSRDD